MVKFCIVIICISYANLHYGIKLVINKCIYIFTFLQLTLTHIARNKMTERGSVPRWPVYSPPENSPRKVPPRLFHPGTFPPNEAWLCEICPWREPVPTRVLNPNASKASYKPKQRSYEPKKYSIFSGGNIPWANIPGWNVPGGVF